MPTRCPDTDTVEIEVDGSELELQCTEWFPDSDDRHEGDHHAPLPPSMGSEHVWANIHPIQPPE